MRYRSVLIYMAMAGVVAGFIRCNDDAELPLPSLKETYAKADKKPFGGNVAFRQVELMYPRNKPRIERSAFDESWKSGLRFETGSLYLCFTPALYLNVDESNAMLDYVYAGNDLFLTAGYIDQLFLARIGISADFSLVPYRAFDSMRNTNTFIIKDWVRFSYHYLPFKNQINTKNNTSFRVLGVNDSGIPNYVVYFYGKGKLFLHCDPRAFSNYFLLQNNNYDYLRSVLSYTAATPSTLYWDDHYNRFGSRTRSRRSSEGASGNFNSLREIMKHPALATALGLSALLLLLYVIFGGKRKQRIINKHRPNENTTVTYTETISRLYLQQKDNKNIAEKMITYFNEHIRNKYFLNSTVVNNEFITTLSRKTGHSRASIESLYRAIDHAQKTETLDDYQLLSLNEQIQNFYKK